MTSPPDAAEIGRLLVDARAALKQLRGSNDPRLVSVGEQWSGALGVMLELTELGPDATVDDQRLHLARIASYLVRGADELRAWTQSLSAQLPPETARLALVLTGLLKRARRGEDELDDETAALVAQANGVLAKLEAK